MVAWKAGLDLINVWASGQSTTLGVKQLHKTAKYFGATVEDESSGKWCVFQIEAPNGKVWNCAGDISTLKVEWRKNDSIHRNEAIRDAIQRMLEGLE